MSRRESSSDDDSSDPEFKLGDSTGGWVNAKKGRKRKRDDFISDDDFIDDESDSPSENSGQDELSEEEEEPPADDRPRKKRKPLEGGKKPKAGTVRAVAVTEKISTRNKHATKKSKNRDDSVDSVVTVATDKTNKTDKTAKADKIKTNKSNKTEKTDRTKTVKAAKLAKVAKPAKATQWRPRLAFLTNSHSGTLVVHHDVKKGLRKKEVCTVVIGRAGSRGHVPGYVTLADLSSIAHLTPQDIDEAHNIISREGYLELCDFFWCQPDVKVQSSADHMNLYALHPGSRPLAPQPLRNHHLCETSTLYRSSLAAMINRLSLGPFACDTVHSCDDVFRSLDPATNVSPAPSSPAKSAGASDGASASSSDPSSSPASSSSCSSSSSSSSCSSSSSSSAGVAAPGSRASVCACKAREFHCSYLASLYSKFQDMRKRYVTRMRSKPNPPKVSDEDGEMEDENTTVTRPRPKTSVGAAVGGKTKRSTPGPSHKRHKKASTSPQQPPISGSSSSSPDLTAPGSLLAASSLLSLSLMSTSFSGSSSSGSFSSSSSSSSSSSPSDALSTGSTSCSSSSASSLFSTLSPCGDLSINKNLSMIDLTSAFGAPSDEGLASSEVASPKIPKGFAPGSPFQQSPFLLKLMEMGLIVEGKAEPGKLEWKSSKAEKPVKKSRRSSSRSARASARASAKASAKVSSKLLDPVQNAEDTKSDEGTKSSKSIKNIHVAPSAIMPHLLDNMRNLEKQLTQVNGIWTQLESRATKVARTKQDFDTMSCVYSAALEGLPDVLLGRHAKYPDVQHLSVADDADLDKMGVEMKNHQKAFADLRERVSSELRTKESRLRAWTNLLDGERKKLQEILAQCTALLEYMPDATLPEVVDEVIVLLNDAVMLHCNLPTGRVLRPVSTLSSASGMASSSIASLTASSVTASIDMASPDMVSSATPSSLVQPFLPMSTSSCSSGAAASLPMFSSDLAEEGTESGELSRIMLASLDASRNDVASRIARESMDVVDLVTVDDAKMQGSSQMKESSRMKDGSSKINVDPSEVKADSSNSSNSSKKENSSSKMTDDSSTMHDDDDVQMIAITLAQPPRPSRSLSNNLDPAPQPATPMVDMCRQSASNSLHDSPGLIDHSRRTDLDSSCKPTSVVRQRSYDHFMAVWTCATSELRQEHVSRHVETRYFGEVKAKDRRGGEGTPVGIKSVPVFVLGYVLQSVDNKTILKVVPDQIMLASEGIHVDLGTVKLFDQLTRDQLDERPLGEEVKLLQVSSTSSSHSSASSSHSIKSSVEHHTRKKDVSAAGKTVWKGEMLLPSEQGHQPIWQTGVCPVRCTAHGARVYVQFMDAAGLSVVGKATFVRQVLVHFIDADEYVFAHRQPLLWSKVHEVGKFFSMIDGYPTDEIVRDSFMPEFPTPGLEDQRTRALLFHQISRDPLRWKYPRAIALYHQVPPHRSILARFLSHHGTGTSAPTHAQASAQHLSSVLDRDLSCIQFIVKPWVTYTLWMGTTTHQMRAAGKLAQEDAEPVIINVNNPKQFDLLVLKHGSHNHRTLQGKFVQESIEEDQLYPGVVNAYGPGVYMTQDLTHALFYADMRPLISAGLPNGGYSVRSPEYKQRLPVHVINVYNPEGVQVPVMPAPAQPPHSHTGLLERCDELKSQGVSFYRAQGRMDYYICPGSGRKAGECPFSPHWFVLWIKSKQYQTF